MLRNRLCDMLGIEHPIIQGGMAPWTTEALSVAVANAGALGVVSSIGLGMKMSPPVAARDDADWKQKSPYELLRTILRWVAKHTAEKWGVFGVDVPLAQEFGELVEGLIKAINDSRKEDADLADRLKVIITSAGSRGYQEGYEEGVKLEMRGIRLLTEGTDPDAAVFLGGEVAGRINQMPSVEQLVQGVSAEAESVIQRLRGLVTKERRDEP